MPSFLPNSPRRRWSPSQWNIVRAGAAIGATMSLGACSDDVTRVEDDGVVDTSDSYTSCQECDYTDYTSYDDWSDDYTGYTDYTDYTGYDDYTDYTDWSDDDYAPDCYIDEDCGPAMQCVYGYCQPLAACAYSVDCEFDEFCSDEGGCVGVDLPTQCVGPAFQEIPLPAEAAGSVVALSFVDLDGDADKELVLLRNDAIVVVDGDQTTTVAYTALALNGIAAADVNEDGALDLIATSSNKLNARVFFADGLGGFADSVAGPQMMLDHASGIDWPTGGAGELLARNQADEAVLLSNVAQLMPQIQALDLGPVEGLGAADFDDDSLLDVVALQGCSPLFSYQTGDLFALEALGPPGTCALGIGDVDGDPLPDLAVVRADTTFSVVTVYSTLLPVSEIGLYGRYTAIQPTTYGDRPLALLAQTGGDLDYVWANDNFSWCRALLPAPPILRFAVGDSDGDGDDEIATVDLAGTVQLWSYD